MLHFKFLKDNFCYLLFLLINFQEAMLFSAEKFHIEKPSAGRQTLGASHRRHFAANYEKSRTQMQRRSQVSAERSGL